MPENIKKVTIDHDFKDNSNRVKIHLKNLHEIFLFRSLSTCECCSGTRNFQQIKHELFTVQFLATINQFRSGQMVQKES